MIFTVPNALEFISVFPDFSLVQQNVLIFDITNYVRSVTEPFPNFHIRRHPISKKIFSSFWDDTLDFRKSSNEQHA